MVWKIFEINQNLVGSICPWGGWAKDRIFLSKLFCGTSPLLLETAGKGTGGYWDSTG